MALSIGQASYGGVTIGPSTVYQWNSIRGLTGLPNVRAGNVPRPNDQGMLAGYDYLGERTFTFNLEVTATQGGNTMQENLTTIRQAFLPLTSLSGGVKPPAAQLFVFNLGEGNAGVGTNKQVVARCEKFEDTVDLGWAGGSFQAGIAKVMVQMSAADPRIYDATIQSSTVGLTIGAGGWTFPWTFPWTFTASTGSLITAVNSGSFNCPAYIVITGPCINPRVQNQTTGQTLQFNFTMGASDTLIIDAYAGTAILNGTASRLSALAPGSYVSNMYVQPGSNTFAFYSNDASLTAAQLTLYWANTWA